MIKAASIFVIAGDGENASARVVRERVHNSRLVAPVDELCRTFVSDLNAPLGQRQQTHHAVQTDMAAIKSSNPTVIILCHSVMAAGYCRSWRVWQRPTRRDVEANTHISPLLKTLKLRPPANPYPVTN